jgi:hypothetical protein
MGIFLVCVFVSTHKGWIAETKQHTAVGFNITSSSNTICPYIPTYLEWFFALQAFRLNRLVVGSGPFGPDAPRPYMSRPFVPQSFPHGSPAALLKRQMAPRFWRFMSSGSKKKEPKWAYLIDAKASHRQRMWAVVSSSTSHFLQTSYLSAPLNGGAYTGY